MNQFTKWLKIIRPQTLFASACPVFIGMILAHRFTYEGCAAVPAIMTLLCALALQVFSNLVNDWYDFKRGSDKSGRLGPARALAEGTVTEAEMLKAIKITLAVCVILGVYLILQGGWPILVIGVLALVFAWLYTATDHSLSYLGIADIFCFLFYGPIAVWGTYWIITGTGSWKAVLAGCVCGLVSECVLMTNNIRDIEADAQAGKRSFPVRFGKRAGELLYLLCVVLMPVFAFFAFGFPAVLIFIAGFCVFFGLMNAEGRGYNKILLFSGLLNVVYVILALI